DMKAEGRLDHERWDLYDTRHVVFRPKQMSREQLMDGYVYLYERAYGPDMTMRRLERWWSRRGDAKGSGISERLFIAAKTAALAFTEHPEHRRLYREATKLMLDRKSKAEVGQFLYMLDAQHFARFLERFTSAERAEHFRLFDDPVAAERISMQW